jgi:uncharacterized protein (UPF0332 family)
MNPDEFLDLAGELATGAREGDWRTTASRAYYAAFHVARRLLRGAGFQVPQADRAHAYLWMRLNNSGHPDIVNAAEKLRMLRRRRNDADYDLDIAFPEARGVNAVHLAMDVVRILRALQGEPAILARVVAAIRAYEQAINDETWHAP